MSIEAALTYTFLFISLYLEVFLLVSFLERRKKGVLLPSQLPHVLPTVAIVVPCFNEEYGVVTTVKSLLSLDYPKEKLEILLVDDGSTDRTLAVVAQFKDDSRIKIFSKENGGKHTAMNYALAHTEAELIGCLDADSIVAHDALLRIIPSFSNPRIAAVTPGIHVREPKTLLQHLQNVEYRLSVFNRFIMAVLGSVFITPGPFSIFRASIIRELGTWRYAHSTEDMEMALRIQEAGYWIANAPRAIVHTATPDTFPRLFRQRVRWTYGWLRNAIDYRHMLGNRKYGNLGLIILPSAIVTIFIGIYFFFRILFYGAQALYHKLIEYQFAGVTSPSFELFYVNTSAMWFIIFVSVALVLVLISTGSFIGTGRRMPPLSTPLFLALYSFMVPLWLTTALVRATFKTGVRWR